MAYMFFFQLPFRFAEWLPSSAFVIAVIIFHIPSPEDRTAVCFSCVLFPAFHHIHHIHIEKSPSFEDIYLIVSFKMSLAKVASVAFTALMMVTPSDAQVSLGITASQASSTLRVGNCKLGAQSISDCDLMGYVIRLAVYSAPGLIVAAFFLLAIPLYLIGKYCCNCCGGRKQTPNFCCPADDMNAVYSKSDILRPKIVLFLALGVAAGAFIWGYVGGGALQSGLLDFGDQINNVPVLMQAQVDAMNAALTVQVYDISSNTYTSTNLLTQSGNGNITTTATAALRQMTSLVGQYVGQAQSYVKQYTFIVFVFFAVPAGFILIGSIFAIFNIRKYAPMTIVWISLVLGVLVWICHAVFCLASMVTADGCVEIHGIAYQQQNVLPALVGCKDSMFSSFTSSFGTMRNATAQGLCQAIQPYCYDASYGTPAQNAAALKVFTCPSPMNCTTVTYGQMVLWMRTALFIDHNIELNALPGTVCTTPKNNLHYNCTIAACQYDCTPSGGVDIMKPSKMLYNTYQNLAKISTTIDVLASQYSSCSNLFSVLISPLDPPCKTITKALIADRQASGLLGLAIIAAVFALAWGSKRFIPLSEEGVPQREDHDEVEALEN